MADKTESIPAAEASRPDEGPLRAAEDQLAHEETLAEGAWADDGGARQPDDAALDDAPAAQRAMAPEESAEAVTVTEASGPWSADDLYRPVTDPSADQVRAEQERLAAERAARREAREAALAPTVEAAVVPPTPVAAPAAAAPQPELAYRRSTDRFFGSLGLFLLRLVLAAILGVRGVNGLLNPQLASQPWANTVLPQTELLGLGVSAAQVGIAILLVFGMLTRLAGFGVAALAGATLAFVMWGPWSPFIAGLPGFLGEYELLQAAAGVLLMCVGSGSWAVDYGFRRRRALDKAARQRA